MARDYNKCAPILTGTIAHAGGGRGRLSAEQYLPLRFAPETTMMYVQYGSYL
jgi:hypothetical protein